MLSLPSQRARVVIAAFMLQGIIIGLMFGYGVFLKALEDDLGWSRTLLSSGSSLAFLVMGLFAFAFGRLSDRFGPRWVLTVTGVCTGLGYVLMSTMQSPWQLLLYFGFLIGLGLATHDVVTLSTVASWYDRKRGLVTGIVKTGTACGQVLVPVVVTLLIASFGWRQSLVYLGIGGMVLLVLFAQLMRRKPAVPAAGEMGTTQSTANQPEPQLQRNGLTMQQARSTHTLWKLAALQFCFLPALITVPVHMVAHATDLGMSTVRAATVLSLIGGSSIAGRLLVGLLIDRVGARIAMFSCVLLLTLALLMLRVIDNPYLLYLLAPLYGIAHGGLFTVVSPAVAEYFGMKAHGAIFGSIVFFGALSGAAGPLVAGMLFDRFRSYDLAFSLLIALAMAGVMLAWSLPSRKS